MSLNRFNTRLILATLVGVIWLGCSDTGPNAPLEGRFSLAPSFNSVYSGIVDVEAMRIELNLKETGELVLDTVRPVEGDSVDLELTVTVLSDQDVFLLRLSLISPAGDTVFTASDIEVKPVTEGRGGSDIEPVDVPLTYTGPGSNAAGVSIFAEGAVVFFGDTILLQAEAFDDQGQPIPNTPIAWRSLDEVRATVPDPAVPRVVGGTERGDARIVAELLTGQADTGMVLVQPIPSVVTVVSGDNQTGIVGAVLPQPVEVEVGAPDGTIRNAVVVFNTTDDGTVAPDTAITDAAGRASTMWTLGSATGTQQLNVAVMGTGLTATATATADAGTPAVLEKVSGDNEVATVNTGVANMPTVVVKDVVGNPVAGATVDFAVVSGGGSLTGATQVTDSAGTVALGSWTLGTVAGANSVSATVITPTPITRPELPDSIQRPRKRADEEMRPAKGGRTAPVEQASSAAAFMDTLVVVFTAQGVPDFVDSLVFTVQPSDAFSGTPISPAIEVTMLDQFGNVTVNDDTTELLLSQSSGTGTFGATISGTNPRAPVNGVVTFDDIAIDSAGIGYRLDVEGSTILIPFATSDSFDIQLGPAANVVIVDATSGFGIPVPDTIFAPEFDQPNNPAILVATVTDLGGNIVPNPIVSWSNSNPAVAVIDSTPGDSAYGRVIGNGTTTVVATSGTATDTLVIVVNQIVATFTLSPRSITVPIGSTTVFTATALDSGGFVATNASVSWITRDTSIAEVTVDSSGTVLGKALGITWLIATEAGGLVDSAMVTVIQPTVGPASMVPNSSTSQSATVGRDVASPPSVLVRDGGGAPLDSVPVVFTVTTGNGTLLDIDALVSQDTVLTDSLGVATVTAWTVDTIAGANAVTATLDTLPPVVFSATGLPDAPAILSIVSGDNQTADVGTVLPVPLVVRVTDVWGNGISGQTVNWATVFGSVSFNSTVTTGTGQTQVNWTLGSSSISQTVTVSSGALGPVVFNATATFPNATILLSLPSDRIAVGGTDTLTVTLTAPAPTPLFPVAVLSENTNVITVAVPDTVYIDSGMTTGPIVLNAVAAGMATVRATAVGYIDGTINVEGSTQVIGMPTTVNVPFGGTASLPIQLSAPAPAGGVTVALLSTNPAAVSVQNPTVLIDSGATLGSVVVNGVAPGSATITATTTNFGSAQTAATTTANLNITTTSVLINELFGPGFTIRLESSGVQIPAPPGGVLVSFASSDSTCAVADTVRIGAGFVSTTANPVYGGSAVTSCNALLTATAVNIDPDSVTVNVSPAPVAVVSGTTVGAGLQQICSSCINLGFNNRFHGGVTVTVKSTNPGLLLVSPDVNTPGTDSIQVNLADGQYFFSYYIHGLEGVADTGIVTTGVTTSTSPAIFIPDTANSFVRQTGVQLSGVLTNGLTTLSQNDDFYAALGYVNGNGVATQNIRSGGQPITVTFTSSQTAVGTLATSTVNDSSISLTIPAGSSRTPTTVAAGGIAFDPLTAGSTIVSASAPGLVSTVNSSQTVNVTAPAMTLAGTNVGAGLQRVCSSCVNLGFGNRFHGGVTVTVRSSDPTLMLVSPNDSTPGTDSIQVFVPDGQYFFSYYIQGLEAVADTGIVTVTATASTNPALFLPDTAASTVRQTGVEVSSVITSGLTTLSQDDDFYAAVGYVNGNGVATQNIRAGGTPISVTFNTSVPAVGLLKTSTLTDSNIVLTIPVRSSITPTTVAAGGVSFDPVSAGSTTVSATAPGIVSTVNASRTVTVMAPVMNLSGTNVGAGLQQNCSSCVNLGFGNRFHGGVTVTVKSSDPASMLVSPNDSTPGTDSIQVFLADGQYFFSYYIQGLEGVADTGFVTVPVTSYTTPGTFLPDTANSTVRRSGIDLASLNQSGLTTLSSNDEFYARIGYESGNGVLAQAIRPGGQAVTVTLASSVPSVGQLVTNTVTSDTVTVTIPVRASISPTTVAAGGVAVDPLTAGTTTITATAPGLVSTVNATVPVTYTAPSITVSGTTVGGGLQTACSSCVNLGFQNRAHGGVTVTVKSSNPAVLLVSPDANTAGTDSIQVFLADQQYFFGYYLQGTDVISNGTVTVQATADVGFSNGSATVTVVQPGVDIGGLTTSSLTTLSPNDDFNVRVGIPSGNGVFLQAVRIGGQTTTATVISSLPSVGLLATNTLNGDSVTVDIIPGQFQSAGSLPAGGIEFDPVGVGTTNIAAQIPGYTSTVNSSLNVAVSGPAITTSATTVGGGLQRACSSCVNLGFTNRFHGGVTVTLTSSDSTVLLLSPDAGTAGTGSIQVPVADGDYFFTYYVQGTDLISSGSPTVIASAPGFAPDTATITVMPPALDIRSLSLTKTAGAANDPFQVGIGYQSGNGISTQAIRTGGQPLTATVTSTMTGVAQLVTTAVPGGGGTVTVAIPVGASVSPSTVAAGGVELDPVAAGTTVVSATIPNVIQTVNGVRTVTVNP